VTPVISARFAICVNTVAFRSLRYSGTLVREWPASRKEIIGADRGFE